MRTSLAILVATTALTAPAWAQDGTNPNDPIILPEITLTANQTEEELARTGATVEVADREDIEKAGDARAADYLSSLPGVSVTSAGGFGTQTYLRLRGLPGQYVKVLFDGIDITDPSGPQINLDWGGILSGSLSRVEVLKGPQSALYGSEAIGGVVSMFTTPSDEPGTHQQAQLEYGSYATTSARYAISHNGDRASVGASVQYFDTDGFSVADEKDGNTEEDGAHSKLVTLNGKYSLTDRLTVGAAMFWQKSDVQTDGTFPTLADNADSSSGIRRGGRIYAEYEGDTARHRLSAQKSQTDRTEVYGGFPYAYEGDRREFAYDGSVDLANGAVLAWGADHSKETYTESGADARGYITNSIYAEYRLPIGPDADVSLSRRYDHNSQFGSETTDRVAVSWRPADGWTIRAQAGTGYRAPSPYELYNAYAGNPELTPETSTGYEAGVEYQWLNGSVLRFNAFRNKIDDLIINDATTGYVYAQSDGTSTSQGVEIAGETPLTDRLTLAGNFTYTDTEGPDGKSLGRVPRRALNMRLDGEITDRASFGVSVQHLSGLVDQGEEMPSFTVIGVSADYDLTDTATAYVRVENLLDEDYQVIRGYGTSDRAVYAGIRANF